MLWWWFKRTLKFPLYSSHTLLYYLEKNFNLNNYWFSHIWCVRIDNFKRWIAFAWKLPESSKTEEYALEKVWNIKVRSSDTTGWSLRSICWGSRWFNYELSLILSIERRCKMSLLVNTCTTLISDFMTFNWFSALYLLLKVLFVYQYSNPFNSHYLDSVSMLILKKWLSNFIANTEWFF